jgi:hypothetical protein
MHPTNCLNCSTMLTADDHFCPSCGQRTDTHRMSMPHIWHDIFHAFTHTNKGMLYLMKELITRPGYVAREYVEGKRKKYFNPFSFLVIVVAVATFLAATFDLMTGSRKDPVSVFINKHANLVIFINVPIGAFFSWLFFKKSGKNFAENLVLSTYASGERSVFYSLLIVPLAVAFPQYFQVIIFSYMFIWCSYMAMATMQFYGRVNVWGFTRGFLAAFLSQLIIFFAISLTYYIYYKYFHQR